jgi:putative chitinase
MIDWKATQQRLLAAGYSPGVIDGGPGPATYTALFAYEAIRQPDAILRSIGREASVHLPRFGISDTPERLAEFLGETSNETGAYTRFEENLHYSAKRLVEIWPNRFKTIAAALPYAWDSSDPDREDVALANLVYGGRMGNEADGTADDDGWDHRGSGLLQHTGAAEYAALKTRLGYAPDDVRDPGKSVLAACDYWQRRNINGFCDRGDWSGARKAINGGFIGLSEVSVRRTRALKVLR